MIDLLESRDKIDKIDMEIVRLFEKRMKICEDVAEYKIATGKKVLDAERERQKLKALRGRAHGEFNQLGIQELFEQIMAISRKRQYQLLTEHGVEDEEKLEMVDFLPLNNVTVVFQGVEGAYSYAAMREYFDDDIKSFHVKTWRDAMEAVVEGKADYGVLPIENSTAGIVAGIYDLLTEYDLNIVGEQIIRVEHALMAPKGASLDSICQVYSHEQGLLQCRPFLAQYPQWEQQAEPNTALAAKLVAESKDVTKAAIASPQTAALYGLEVLAEKINFNDQNYTRFVIVSNAPQITEACDKVSVVFTVPHTEGSLHRVLAVFATNGRNLLKLESRPIVGKCWEYTFFADFSGNLRSEGMDDTVRQLIDETLSLRILGNYKAAHI